MVDIEEIRERARALLEEGRVQSVLGYRRGTAGATAEPAFITHPEETETLVWDPTCVHNLTLHLVRERKRQRTARSTDNRPIAVVAKGCDSRAIVVLLQEKSLRREDVYVIGVSCEGTGVVDSRKLARHLGGKAVRRVAFEGPDGFKVTVSDGEVAVPVREVMADRCLECRAAHPALHDSVFGEAVEQRNFESPFRTLGQMEAASEAERWGFWQRQFDRCIRCFACRSVCPMCYCDECVVDSINFIVVPETTAEEKANRIRWIERSASASENAMYHLVRAMHLAGRCTDCGECERVCPMNIPLRLLNTKLEKEALEMFDYQAGIDPDSPSLVSSFNDRDPGGFIR
jgi:coenzyme F420-reducing hydrogenase beta subunit